MTSLDSAAQHKYPKLKNYSIFILTFLFSTLICWGVSGGSPRLHDILLLWVIFNTLWLKPIIFKIASPLLLLWILYAPIGLQYGYPNSGMVASLFETTRNEAWEFFDPTTIFGFIVVIGLSTILYFATKKITITGKQRKFFKYFSLILTVLFLVNIVSIKHKRIHWGYSELLGFIPHTITQYNFYLTNKQKIQQIQDLKDDWQIINFQPKYQNYVLVLGESASKNYLSAYGYPVATSPFLENVHGTKYTQAIAAGAYTIKAVPRLLTIPNEKEVEYHNSIMHLANKLDMPTYWISNQDKIGEFDNEISYIAMNAKHSHYLSETAPTTARYDYQLLPAIKQAISEPSDKPKLIVVHLMGSHTRFSKRVDFDKEHFDLKPNKLSDYLSSLLQTDMLLEEIYQDLQNSKQPFSMIYISDHALMPKNLKHGTSQFSLQVPLFKMSSDDNQQTTNDDIISGFSFVWFLTEWLGIDTKNQANNTFLNHYQAKTLEEVRVFDDKTTSYTSLEPFDGELLQPEK